MNKIKILWIEDNPIGENTVSDKINPRIKYPDFPNNEFFEYYIFQHPVEVKEYLEVIKKIKEGVIVSKNGNSILIGIPDIVVFDYKLSDGLSLNGASGGGMTSVHKEFSIKHSLTNILSDSYKIPNVLFLNQDKYRSFDVGEFIKNEIGFILPEKTEQNKDEFDGLYKKRLDEFNNDEFGLFSGITVLREFGDYITCGIPASLNKPNTASLSNNSAFFEWLISYDLENAIKRPDRGHKNWDAILKDGVELLRNRIEMQLSEGKIIISYSHLHELSQLEKLKKENFIFESVYGSRSLLLDGLFFYEPIETRNEKISEWAKRLLDIYATKSGFTFKEYEIAKEISKTLILQYQARIEVDNRYRLSELVVKLITETIEEDEKSELEKLKSYFGVTDDKIKAYVNKQGAEYSNLESNVVDYREKKKNLKPELQRLIVLFSDLWLHKVYQDFCKKAEKGEMNFYLKNQLLDRPSFAELRYVLFPVPFNPLVLPDHELFLPPDYRSKTTYEVWDKHLSKKDMGTAHIGPQSEYPANLSSVEKNLCLTFASEIKLNTYFPTWLQK